MTETYFPFDAGAGSSVYEAQWGTMMRHLLSTGVIRARNSTFDLNLLEVYADGSALEVYVKTGSAFVDGFFYNTDAEVTKSISTADATNPRIDRVVLKLDRAANTITLAVLTGTPAASPVAPSLTQTTTGVYEMQLAQVYVGANVSVINASNITDERIFNDGGFDQRTILFPLLDNDTAIAVADPVESYSYTVPPELDRYVVKLTNVSTPGAAGSTQSRFRMKKNGTSLHSTTDIYIDASDENSWDATSQNDLNASLTELRTGDKLRLQCVTAGTGAKGLQWVVVVARHG